jgi:hypothetical protein
VLTQGGETTTYTWDQIREVVHFVHPGWQKFLVATRKGRTLTLTSEIGSYLQLGNAIAERTAQTLFPGVLERIEAGEAIRFGALNVNRSGVLAPDQVIPWECLVSIAFGYNGQVKRPQNRISNMLHLRLNHACQVQLDHIANYPLFERVALHYQPLCQVERAF